MTREEAQRRVAKGFGWWEVFSFGPTSRHPPAPVYCARLKDGTTMRVRWP